MTREQFLKEKILEIDTIKGELTCLIQRYIQF